VGEISPEDETEERKSAPEVDTKLITSEPHLESPELASPDPTEVTQNGQNKISKDFLKNRRQKFFNNMSAATSRLSLKPSVRLTRLGNLFRKVKGTASPRQQDCQRRSVSFLSKLPRYADICREGVQIHWVIASKIVICNMPNSNNSFQKKLTFFVLQKLNILLKLSYDRRYA
jgi:hypothetical protein